jgi:hypothetical protein
MEMGVHKINEQKGKIDPRYQYKTITPKKWMFEILN